MINQNQILSKPTAPVFRQGMTLDEYLGQMKTIPKEQLEIDEKAEQDLYQTSRKVQQKLSKKILTYQIRQIDQDNYEESLQGLSNRKLQTKTSAHLVKEVHKASNRNTFAFQNSAQDRNLAHISRDYRIRRQSNSPYNPIKKQVLHFSPNKIFSQTLNANNQWRIHKDPNPKLENSAATSATIYGKFMKGLKNNDKHQEKHNEKQKYFKKKNNQEIERIAKYQKDLQQKYSKYQLSDLLSMKIEGIPDKLCERKLLNGKKGK